MGFQCYFDSHQKYKRVFFLPSSQYLIMKLQVCCNHSHYVGHLNTLLPGGKPKGKRVSSDESTTRVIARVREAWKQSNVPAIDHFANNKKSGTSHLAVACGTVTGDKTKDRRPYCPP